MTERDYIEALVNGMRAQMAEAEERGKSLANPAAARQFMEDQRTRSLDLLDSLDPPEDLRPLHARLRQMAANSLEQSDEEDQAMLEDILHLAALADRYGLELVPGMTSAEIAESIRNGNREWAPTEGDWETRLRRSLADDGREDVDGIVERMRELRRES